MTENAHTVENETIGSDKSRASTITSVDELVVSSEPDTRDVPCLTFRFWCIGLLFSIGIPFVNQFFFYRTHPLRMKSMLALLLSYPLGLLMARILPKKSISFGRGLTVSLNPGPFNIVEHMLIVSMTSTAIRQSYSIAILTVIKLFYKKSLNYGIAVLFTIIPQVLGYGIAGIVRRFVVWPDPMIWPVTLPYTTLFKTLHKRDDETNQQNSKRLKFFFIVFICQFFYYWLPGYMMPILTTFSWICLIQPRSILLSQLTSCHGLGLGGGCLQFDWNSITAFLGSPIVPPFWSQLNIFVGFILFAWIVVPFTYYTNLWNTKLFPIVSNNLYTINGTVYKHTFILDKQSQFNETAYELYSPVRMTVMFAFHYGIHFAILTSIIMHTILWHSQDLITQLKTSIKNSLSTKVIITTRNTVVPDYWFVILFVVTFIVTIIMCHIGQLIPVYYLFVAIIIPFLFILPAGIIVAITGQWINVNVLCDFVGGLLLHGNPIGNITFLTFAREPLLNALSLCSELKNGDYLKIPTRSLFIAHLLGMLIGGFVNYTTSSYMLNTVENICTLENPLWSCPKILTLYSTSVIWGILGPRKIFGKISPYSHLLWGFLLGLLLPILFWFIYKKIYPQRHWLKYIHVPVMLIGIGMMPTTSAGNYVTWLLIGFVCNYILHKYSLQWWKQYAYIFSIAMDSGVAVSGIFIFFIFSHQNIKFPKWWGLANDGGCPLARKTFSGK